MLKTTCNIFYKCIEENLGSVLVSIQSIYLSFYVMHIFYVLNWYGTLLKLNPVFVYVRNTVLHYGCTCVVRKVCLTIVK